MVSANLSAFDIQNEPLPARCSFEKKQSHWKWQLFLSYLELSDRILDKDFTNILQYF